MVCGHKKCETEVHNMAKIFQNVEKKTLREDVCTARRLGKEMSTRNEHPKLAQKRKFETPANQTMCRSVKEKQIKCERKKKKSNWK